VRAAELCQVAQRLARRRAQRVRVELLHAVVLRQHVVAGAAPVVVRRGGCGGRLALRQALALHRLVVRRARRRSERRPTELGGDGAHRALGQRQGGVHAQGETYTAQR
jgi:hypothetical protein